MVMWSILTRFQIVLRDQLVAHDTQMATFCTILGLVIEFYTGDSILQTVVWTVQSGHHFIAFNILLQRHLNKHVSLLSTCFGHINMGISCWFGLCFILLKNRCWSFESGEHLYLFSLYMRNIWIRCWYIW